MRALTGLPFDDIRALLERLPPPDEAAADAVRARAAEFVASPNGLGRLTGIAEWLAGWQSRAPAVNRPSIVLFAASHGAGPDDSVPRVRARLEAASAGTAAINRLCLAADAGLKAIDLAVDVPVPDVRVEDAFDEAGCAATIAFGMEGAAGGADLLGIADFGVGNQASVAALAAALFGGTAADWAEDDLGDAATVLARIEGTHDPLELIRRAGGREIAASLGAILAARFEKIPVLIDGAAATIAAAALHRLAPPAIAHCRFAQACGPAHRRMLEALRVEPLLDLGLTEGEGTAAALAVPLVRAAARAHAPLKPAPGRPPV